MNEKPTPSTYIRTLKYGALRKLSDFLDPEDRWRDVVVSIRRSNGEPRYSQHHVRRFEALVAQGKSPTIELLHDWGTTNSTVGELVDILRSHKLFAPADLLLPVTEKESLAPVKQPICPVPDTGDVPEMAVLQETERHTPPDAPTLQLKDLQEGTEPDSTGCLSFTYQELMEITGNFDDRPVSCGGSRLGEGGFGTVYKGFIHNKVVAVKRLNDMEDISLEELRVQFNQEIQTLKMLKHNNLVEMVGFTCDGQQLCLVYTYMANGSLLDRLACMDSSPPLSWQQRCLIAAGTAQALEYLHSNHHIHRDVKSANILLDEDLVAKLSDFGLTRALAKQSSTTVVTECIIGTRAYMAPEALRGEITPKSDIFSFGVVLLEILSGLKPVDEKRDPQFLMELRYDIDDEDEDLTLEDFMDKKMKDWKLSQTESVYALATGCLLERKTRRPAIKQVVAELEEVVRGVLAVHQVEEGET